MGIKIHKRLIALIQKGQRETGLFLFVSFLLPSLLLLVIWPYILDKMSIFGQAEVIHSFDWTLLWIMLR